MMVRPAAFGWNPETGDSNLFQSRSAPSDAGLVDRARSEFDAMVGALREAGVEVHVVDDRPDPVCPDAVFPNNWVSFHEDGTIVLYPMLAPTRRAERRPELLHELTRQGSYSVDRLLDLTHHELAGRYLEGTGSMVLDRVAGVAYACRSPRTDGTVLDEFCAELGFEPCVFDAADRGGVAIYHTNVLLAIGRRFAVVCGAAIAARDRTGLLARLADGRRHVIDLGFGELEGFAGNMLELAARDGAGVLVMSERARDSLDIAAYRALQRHVDRVVVANVDTIERTGGGSVRCMLAEVFLPSPG